ncbi:MAG TPA: HD domain-containing phosphohydrolase [Acidimicrobiales bacterium]|nr:HD domain-containing phosphohydrolase [Acidimicrobiales bacterium]
MAKRASGVRLSELLVALSLATDLGFGQPAEHMARAARIALRIGERLGLDAADLATLYDVAILTYVGCPTYGNEAATVFGDDIDFRADALRIDLAGMPARRFMMSRADGVKQKLTLMATNGRGVVEQMASHCAAAGELATRLGLNDDVRAGVQQAYARWDGKGVPADLEGAALSLGARIAHIAEACEVFSRTDGVDGAVAMVKARQGTHFDPQLTQTVVVDPDALFKGIDEDTVDEVLDAEPVARPPLADEQLDDALATIGDFCDLRHPCFTGHSRGVAELVAAACDALHVPAAEARVARRAASVHDVGRFGVPAQIWTKPGPLTSHEQERMRMHAYYVERIFSRPEPLRRVGLLAGTHHERTDGSGYHRGTSGALLSVPARVLAAADAFHAMTQPRPYRPARTPEDAAAELRRDARDGRLDPAAVDAVLAAAGQTTSRARSGGPAGLTAREADVLALLTKGMANKAIARELSISPKTVGNHIERIYTKLGVSNRAAAAMRAMQYGLVQA